MRRNRRLFLPHLPQLRPNQVARQSRVPGTYICKLTAGNTASSLLAASSSMAGRTWV